MRRMSAWRQPLTGTSISRYLPPIGTAGLERVAVSGKRRDALAAAEDDGERVVSHGAHSKGAKGRGAKGRTPLGLLFHEPPPGYDGFLEHDGRSSGFAVSRDAPHSFARTLPARPGRSRHCRRAGPSGPLSDCRRSEPRTVTCLR